MSYAIQFKRTTQAETEPDSGSILEGELAINLVDKKLYTMYNDEIINIGFDYDEYIGSNFVTASGGPLTGLLSFDESEYEDVDSDIINGTDYNLVHKGYVDTVRSNVNDHIINRVPVGSIIIWPYLSGSNDIPEGWLECDGEDIPTDDEDYTLLISMVGDTTPDLTNVSSGYVYIIRYLEDQLEDITAD